VCKRLDEDGAHCFLKCKYVKKCWEELGLEQVRSELAVLKSAKEMVAKILNMPEMLCSKILTLLWKWWSVRNAVNAGDKQLTPTVIAASVRYNWLLKFRESQSLL
jgi:hypothetical protein